MRGLTRLEGVIIPVPVNHPASVDKQFLFNDKCSHKPGSCLDRINGIGRIKTKQLLHTILPSCSFCKSDLQVSSLSFAV